MKLVQVVKSRRPDQWWPESQIVVLTPDHHEYFFPATQKLIYLNTYDFCGGRSKAPGE